MQPFNREELLSKFLSKHSLPLSLDRLDEATTHDSYLATDPGKKSNERLEIIGDAVLDLISSDWLYDELPEGSEALITQLRSELVDNQTLGKVAKRLELDSITLASKGAKINEKQLADSLEAIFGGIFKENNLEICKTVFLQWFGPNLEEMKSRDFKPNLAGKNQNNPKNYLFEWLDSYKLPHPKLDLVSELGEPPKKTFISRYSVLINGQKIAAKGKGSSKLISEKSAAKKLLNKLKEMFEEN
jgi:ribonuclease-3